MPAGKEFSRRYQVICGKDAEGKEILWRDLGLRYTKGWIYAVRITGANGWQWAVSSLEKSAYRKVLEEAGLSISEVVEIQSDTFEEREFDPPGRFSFVTKRWRGWIYDQAANCWRAPEEAIAPLPGSPVLVGHIDVQFEVPEHGWLPFTLTAGDWEVFVDASNVYEPFGDLMTWLHSLADGHDARLMMDVEDVYMDFHVLPTDGPLVRLFVTMDQTDVGAGETIEMDVLIDRLALIRSIYRPFIAFWEGEEFAQVWEDHWEFALTDFPDDQPCGLPYHLRSERLDALCRTGL